MEDTLEPKLSAEEEVKVPEPLVFPDRSWKITLSRSDTKRSIRIPMMVPVLAVLFVLFLFVSTLVLFFGGSSGKDTKKLQVLLEENRRLKTKLDYYDATVDSIFKRVEALQRQTQGPSGQGGIDHPYVPPKSQSSASRAGLEQRFNHLDTRISYLLTRLEGALPLTSIEVRPIVPAPSSGDGIPSIYPCFGVISSGFGLRVHPVFHDLIFHQGLDIANEMGTPIYATADGVVQRLDSDSGYGKRIIIAHQDGYETRYGHLYSYQVHEGDEVCKGQIIGLMGSSGISTGSHLHYEVLQDGDKINPTAFLNRIDTTNFAGR